MKRVDSVSLGVETVFTCLTVVDHYDELKTKYFRIIPMLSKSLGLDDLPRKPSNVLQTVLECVLLRKEDQRRIFGFFCIGRQ